MGAGRHQIIAAMRLFCAIVNGAPTNLVNNFYAGLTGNAAVTYARRMSKKTKPPVALYSALADATRCRILEILQAGPIPVHTLAAAFAISRPAISRHLRVLKTAGLVAEVKKGRENLYAFKPAKLDRARLWLETISAPAAEPPASRPPATKRTKQAKPIIASDAQAAPATPPARKPKPAPAIPADTINQMGFDF
ncbi:MAG: winged helix-turn-helix transcriptional regulator [Devosia sp.]|nr:winged helix-turn-helix transcriptional regulator [Devosia sp.]